MFGKKRPCKDCSEKDRQIVSLNKSNLALANLFDEQKLLANSLKTTITDLRTQNKDLLDRFMSLNEKAFLNYKAETRPMTPLYPVGVDAKGEKFSYKEANPDIVKEEIHRAFGEEVITVEEDDK